MVKRITNKDLYKLIQAGAKTSAKRDEELYELIQAGAKRDEELYELIQAGAKTSAKRDEELYELIKIVVKNVESLQDDMQYLRSSVQELQKGSFTEQEKEELLAMARHYDKWLEDDTLGKDRITLARKEYDSAALARGFTNRFAPVPA